LIDADTVRGYFRRYRRGGLEQLLRMNYVYENFAEYKRACQGFFDQLDKHADSLRSLLTENFETIRN
jgi:hypothetical protein